MRVLLIEDEDEWAVPVINAVEELDGSCIRCTNLDSGIALALEDMPPYHVVILDRNFAGDQRDGLIFFEEFAKRRPLPKTDNAPDVIVISVKNKRSDRISGFDAGAICYLTKPFHNNELQAILRRLIANKNCIRGDLELDLRARIAYWQDTEFNLAPHSFSLLHLLAEKPGEVIPRNITGRCVYGNGYSNDDIDRAVLRLRRETRPIFGEGLVITVKSLGHKINAAALNMGSE